MVTATLVAGMGLGLAEAHLGHQAWPLAVGLTVCCGVILWLTRHWVVAPFDRLIRKLHAIANDDTRDAMRGLPMQRGDETGQISQVVRQIAVAGRRDRSDARQLRATMDQRLRKAIDHATTHLREISMRDPLTDLGNRRFLDQTLEPLVESCRASRSNLCCVVIDIDNFKQVNDTLGHVAGDRLISFVGGLLRASIRDGDYAVRTGGDEFLLLLPGCPRYRVDAMLKRIIAMFRQHVRVVIPDDILPDLSMGASFLDNTAHRTGAKLIDIADKHLYNVKETGKAHARIG